MTRKVNITNGTEKGTPDRQAMLYLENISPLGNKCFVYTIQHFIQAKHAALFQRYGMIYN